MESNKNHLPTILFTLLIASVAISGYFAYMYQQNQLLVDNLTKQSTTPTPEPTPTPSPVTPPTPTLDPTPATVTPSPTPEPTPTLSFTEEEKLLRKTLAGFEMYVSNSNTAGALTFFTKAVSQSAKDKYESIKSKDLPFKLTSWRFVDDSTNTLITEKITNGYSVRMVECRDNQTSCSVLFIELVRNDQAENGFSINRYYDTTYQYQNNLGEDIKYQGFSL
jgi:hypothetical protein